MLLLKLLALKRSYSDTDFIPPPATAHTQIQLKLIAIFFCGSEIL